jgi:hypothetical protein
VSAYTRIPILAPIALRGTVQGLYAMLSSSDPGTTFAVDVETIATGNVTHCMSNAWVDNADVPAVQAMLPQYEGVRLMSVEMGEQRSGEEIAAWLAGEGLRIKVASGGET